MFPNFRSTIVSALIAAVLAGCGAAAQSQIGPVPIGAPGGAAAPRAGNSYHTIYSFGKSGDGQQPKAGLINVNGTLYGTTYGGGASGNGTVFSVTTGGVENVVHSFQSNSDGINPSASLTAAKGVLYGTTEYGGADGEGTVFKISTIGTEKVLYSFQGHYHGYDGAHPVASLIDVKGKLYGTTSNGGDNSECHDSCGTVYSISTSGREKVLHSFALYSDGAVPLASLTYVKGIMYGTTEAGGSISIYGPGTVFTISTTGDENVLYSFQGSVGAAPLTSLTDVGGELYGTTGYNGPDYGGTAFRITTGGKPTLLHSFGSGSDGSRPAAPMVNVKGPFYGTTELGGAYGKGTIFKMNLSGKEKVLHSFGKGSDGATPLAGLIDVDGTLYGTTSTGGAHDKGTVFALTP